MATTYAVQVHKDGAWQDAYTTEDRSDAEGVWRRILDAGPRGRARLVEVDVLRSSEEAGGPAF